MLLVDSLAAAAGGAASVSSNTTYIESAAGVGDGARTGLASVVTGALFLLALFFTPLVQIVPYEAAAPALVIVGFLMISAGARHRLGRLRLAIPAFLTIVAHAVHLLDHQRHRRRLHLATWCSRSATGRAREVHPLLWVVAALFVVYFALDPIEQLLGVQDRPPPTRLVSCYDSGGGRDRTTLDTAGSPTRCGCPWSGSTAGSAASAPTRR